MTSPHIQLGVIVGAHGVRGQVKVKSFTERAEDVVAYGPLYDAAGAEISLSLVRSAGTSLVAEVQGVTDRNAAEALRGTALFANRDAVLGGADALACDLVGMQVETPAGAVMGTVRAVHNFGAGDIVEVTTPEGDALFPYHAVRAVHAAERRVVLEPPEVI